ncbi:phosphoglycerate mutase-like protein, partial [Athelia psychrophila]
ASAETILGAYIYHRHGDRTAKLLPPVSLTDLGYREVWQSGLGLNERYITAAGLTPIAGISSPAVLQSQLTASTSDDVVLMSSAQGFLQGLYPPLGNVTQTLRNASAVPVPLDGFQIIPVHTVTAASSTSESAGWLQGATGCANAETGSLEYYNTSEFAALMSSTQAFYQTLNPILNGTFTSAATTFQNAYTIFDTLNVADIHNTTLNTSAFANWTDTLFQVRTLADQHEWNLAYNASAPIRAVAGATVAAQILAALNTTVTGGGKSKLNMQFGSYGTFFSLFGLMQMPAASALFMGMPDYASYLSLELVTNASATPFPAPADISVRFLYHNGTSAYGEQPAAYPMFGQPAVEMPWTSFAEQMSQIAIGTQEQWCSACGNSTGTCAPAALGISSTSPTKKSRMSNAVAGVIGAVVALAVVLGAEALIMLLAGLRL